MSGNKRPDTWSGILCHLELAGSRLTPLSGKIASAACGLARRAGAPAYAVLMTPTPGKQYAEALAGFAFNRALLYPSPLFETYTADTYAEALIDAVDFLRPSVVLAGGGDVGKDIAPLAAARFRTGLTADCTGLEILSDGSLLQIRPAFGGNVMAEILTPETRPQFATVRDAAAAASAVSGGAPDIIYRDPPAPGVNVPTVLERHPLPREESITGARLIVAVGCGLKEEGDIETARRLAGALGGRLASTRGLVERGWMPPSSQIGLSGHSVSPDILLTLGVSGSVQFMAGIGGAKYIIAVNSDPSAGIFSLAHLSLCCDLYEVLPELFAGIECSAFHETDPD
jgi:electron transfer flavoprotein alpha subunit